MVVTLLMLIFTLQGELVQVWTPGAGQEFASEAECAAVGETLLRDYPVGVDRVAMWVCVTPPTSNPN